VSPSKFQANWRRPFVAAEMARRCRIGKSRFYLLDPAENHAHGGDLKDSISLLVALLVWPSALAAG